MSNEKVLRRLQQVEEQLAHEQHTVKQLNEIVIELREQIERVEKLLAEQKIKIELLQQKTSEDLPHEKPPHY